MWRIDIDRASDRPITERKNKDLDRLQKDLFIYMYQYFVVLNTEHDIAKHV